MLVVFTENFDTKKNELTKSRETVKEKKGAKKTKVTSFIVKS